MNWQHAIVFSFVVCTGATAANGQSTVHPDGEEQLRIISKYLRGAHKTYTESIQVGAHGQNNRIFQTRESWKQVVNYYKDAYRFQSKLPNNVKCKGWLVMHAKRRATFTLYQGKSKYMVIAQETPDGTELKLYGFAYRHRSKRIKRRPHHRGLPERKVRRYGI